MDRWFLDAKEKATQLTKWPVVVKETVSIEPAGEENRFGHLCGFCGAV